MLPEPVDLDGQLELLFRDRVSRVRIDPETFTTFTSRYSDPREGVDAEKLLEYLISYTWLDLDPSDVFMDVAAQDCPFAFFVRDTIGCKTYRQDLYYLRPGVHRQDVGGDATNLPFPDGSLSKLALHNSFEHFEGDADIQFLREAARVLRPRGKVCIVPLFLASRHLIETDAGWIDQHGKKHLWGIGARFARTYDPASLAQRVLAACEPFRVTLHIVENAADIDPTCYLRYFLILEKAADAPSTPPMSTPPADPWSAATRRFLHRQHVRVGRWGRALKAAARRTREG